MKYSIFEGNLERLEKKLVRIQNKCKKYGASFKYEVVGEEFKEVETEDGSKTLRFVIVDVEGFAKINNWEFVATIDHHEGRNVVRNIIDIDIPERYWTSECYCEHCATIRRRNDTFLVHNTETNEFKQVGRNCLRDFTGGYDAELAASYIAMYDELIECESTAGYTGGFVPYKDVDKVLKMSKAIIAKLGFTSTSESEGHSSKSSLYDFDDLLAHGETKFNKYLVEAGVLRYYEENDNSEYIDQVKKYFLEAEETSSYIKNLKTIFGSEYCKSRDYGYIVSAVFSYDREMEKRQQKAIAEAKRVKENEVSQYQGQVGQRITFKVSEFKCISSYENNYSYYDTSVTYLYKLVDNEGNVFMWSTSNSIDENKSIDFVVGTVKKHEEYKGLKQTWVTRCKVTYKKEKEKEHEQPAEDPVKVAFEMLDALESGEAC